MCTRRYPFRSTTVLLAAFALLTAVARVSAHCDTLNGPVVAAAKAALNSGDVTPVLKWVRAEDEPEIKAAFARSMAVRSKGKEASELADLYFFETVVRIHRAGEGAPYTGLKAAGEGITSLIRAADSALEGGSDRQVVTLAAEKAVTTVESYLSQAKQKRADMDKSVAAGREFVAAYVRLIHYLEQVENHGEAEVNHQR